MNKNDNYVLKSLREQFKTKDDELVKLKKRREDLKDLTVENQEDIDDIISDMKSISDAIIKLKEEK